MFLNWNRALFVRPSWIVLLFFQLSSIETQNTHRANSEVCTRATWSPESHFGNKRNSFSEGWVPVRCRVIVSSPDDCIFSLYLHMIRKRGRYIEHRRCQRMIMYFNCQFEKHQLCGLCLSLLPLFCRLNHRKCGFLLQNPRTFYCCIKH